jgi:rfaE bifunctional protein kinase chain/domain
VFEAGEIQYSSADIFYSTQDELEQKHWLQFQEALRNQDINLDEVVTKVSKQHLKKILVIGDTIVDRYVACDPIGMSNEAPVVVVKELESRDYVGGAGIVAAHVATLSETDCTFLSVTGRDNQADLVSTMLAKWNVNAELLEDISRPTTFKIRYLVGNQKLFRVSRLKEHSLTRNIEDAVIATISNMAPFLDGILVCDFVYGVVTTKIIEKLAQVSKKNGIPLFGDLQCSSQVGNISKFKDFELLCPTEREARIALSNQDDGIEYIANSLMDRTRATNLIVKLGSDGFIAYSRDNDSNFVHRQHFPALTPNPMDVAGVQNYYRYHDYKQ